MNQKTIRPSAARVQAVFGAADGVTVVLGLLIAVGATRPHAVFPAAVGAGVAEWVGMTAGAWLSAEAGPGPAFANGTAALVACVLPALPFLLLTGPVALVLSVFLVAAVAAVVAWWRPQRGWAGTAQTFGVLIAAGVLVYLASAL